MTHFNKTLIIGAFMLLAVSAMAQSRPGAVATPKAVSPVTQRVTLAGRLVHYGYQNRDALSLLQAAGIIRGLNMRTAADGQVKVTEMGGTTAPSTAKTGGVSFDVSQLLADATTYANGNKNILALIKDAQKVTQGSMPDPAAPIRRHDCVRASDTDIWTINSTGGEDVTVCLVGDGSTELELSIYDQEGNLIATDTDTDERCTCSFVISTSGTFYIKIKNNGNQDNTYELVVSKYDLYSM